MADTSVASQNKKILLIRTAKNRKQAIEEKFKIVRKMSLIAQFWEYRIESMKIQCRQLAAREDHGQDHGRITIAYKIHWI